jgi:nucleotide-binding universal stress UspA family protein
MTPVYITGYDDRPSSQAAADYARQLAAATDARVVAAHVYHAPTYPSGSPYALAVPPVLPEEIEASARAHADLLLSTLPTSMERLAIRGTSVPRELHDLARERDAALLVVGATHRGPIGRVLPGSIGERLLHGAPCPVLVVPEGDGNRPIARIAVAYDGGEEAQRALALAARAAERFGVGIDLISILDPGVAALYAHRGADHLETAAREVRLRGLDVQTRLIVERSAADVVADCDGIDLLVTGSRGYGPLRSVLLGSASRHIVDHAPCPVLVLPRGSDGGLLGETLGASAAAV